MKNILSQTNTIVAAATPPGIGALGIVRMSGGKSVNIAEKIFFPKKTPGKSKNFKTRTLYHGEIRDKNALLDEVMMGIMKSPGSYTGEDMVEITCHGSRAVISKII